MQCLQWGLLLVTHLPDLGSDELCAVINPRMANDLYLPKCGLWQSAIIVVKLDV